MSEELQEKEVIEINPEDVIDKDDNIHIKINNTVKKHYIERNISLIAFVASIVLYVVLSLAIKTKIGYYNLSGWAFWWILFLQIPLIPQIYWAIKWKNPFMVPIFSISLTTFLLLGMLLGKWHPGWVIFFLPPLYHSLVKIIIIRRLNK